eukprot:TRINITY_DN4926_c0_g1_i1.p1 TRINITY_DN4926_c0_g1~~TRINITY_DN4926_c0_g1_i1.p1  ORF type:complete len:137 (-),score=14.14 TRINITY_DN4926_c0_g1_i1:54-464(-)
MSSTRPHLAILPTAHVTPSRTLLEARLSSLRMYRRVLKATPLILRMYKPGISIPQMRELFRYHFVSTGTTEDPRLIDNLVLNGEIELEETLQNFKSKCHILSYFHGLQEKKKNEERLANMSEEDKIMEKFLGEDSM